MPSSIAHQLLELAPTTEVADALLATGPLPTNGKALRIRRASLSAIRSATAACDVAARVELAQDHLLPAQALSDLTASTLAALTASATVEDREHFAGVLDSLAINPAVPAASRHAIAQHALANDDDRLLCSLTLTMHPLTWLPVIHARLPVDLFAQADVWLAGHLETEADPHLFLDTVSLLLSLPAADASPLLESLVSLTMRQRSILRVDHLLAAFTGTDRDRLTVMVLRSGNMPSEALPFVIDYLRRTPKAPATMLPDRVWKLTPAAVLALVRTRHPVASALVMVRSAGESLDELLQGPDFDDFVGFLHGEHAAAFLSNLSVLSHRLTAAQAATLVTEVLELGSAGRVQHLHENTFSADTWANLDEDTLAQLVSRSTRIRTAYLTGRLHRPPTVTVLVRAAGSFGPTDLVMQHTHELMDISAGPDSADLPHGTTSVLTSPDPSLQARMEHLDAVLDVAGPRLLLESSWRRPGEVPLPLAYAATRIRRRFGDDPDAWTLLSAAASSCSGSWTETLDVVAALRADPEAAHQP